MKSDMETACDSMVAYHMEFSQKKEYAKTILAMYANPADSGLVLGMGLAKNKKEAERRIRAIFTGPHSRPKIKAVSVLLTVALAVTCFTTACQPAFKQTTTSQPSQAPVSSVSPNLAPQPSVQPTPYEVPIPWDQIETFGNLTVDIGTLVILPDGPYPVQRVQPADFTVEQLKKMVDYFTGITNASSADISAIYPYIEADLQTPFTTTIGLKDNTVDAIIGWMMAKYNLYSRFTFGTGGGYIADGRNLYIEENGVYSWNTASGISEADWNKQMSALDFSYTEQAQAKAEQVLDDLGIKGLKLWTNNVGVLLPYKEEYNTYDGRQPQKGGFIFEYVRSTNDIYGFTAHDEISSPLESEYMPAYPMETVSIFITEDGGVEYFNWNCPLDIVATEKENTDLLPFGQIKNILLENINVKWVPENFTEDESADIDVRSAQLMMVLVQSEDNILQTFLKPAWVFNTNETFSPKDNQQFTNYYTYVIDATTGLPIHMPGAQLGSAQTQESAVE